MRNKTIILLTAVTLLAVGVFHCYGDKKMNQKTKDHKYSNHLAGESSPYLLMHAKNPVDWYPWGDEAWEKAKKENKLVIISIGYAACHWCHVMEEESFEDPEVAKIMNDYFVAIKVDREERPDIDQIYMNAVQLITGSGGWPLNAIALPDGRPFYAGTYFPKENWMQILQRIHDLYKTTPERLKEQAANVTNGIKSSERIAFNTAKPEFNQAQTDALFSHWRDQVDFKLGGTRGAPKFPMPIGHRFLLKHYHGAGDEKALQAVTVTLDRMALGGIYDQVGGGFARYSTDAAWKVPHFEKMLYDNGQLVSLYAEAYQLTKDPLYKQVVYETLEFVEREMTSPRLPKGGIGFYSSLDADSEGEEGKFYVWTKKELDKHLGKNAALMSDYYSVVEKGNWEHGRNILFRTRRDEEFAKAHNISVEALRKQVEAARKKLLKAREARVRPPLDDKILTAWNALMLTGYVDAYRVFDDEDFLKKARENARFILGYMLADDGRLNRNFKESKGSSTINAFLDDYAFTIRAFIALYQATFEEEWLTHAEKLLSYTLEHFYDKESRMFYYTSDTDPELIARKMEVTDNVIPASNSMMGINLYLLGEYFYNRDYIEKSKQMLNNVKDNLVRHGAYFANWGLLLTYFVDSPFEVAIVGDDCFAVRRELDKNFLPNMIVMGGKTEGRLPLLEDKLVRGRTTIYVCKDKACRRPVTDPKKALKQME